MSALRVPLVSSEELKQTWRNQKIEIDAAALESELRRVVSGEVRFDAGSRALYATDGSNYLRDRERRNRGSARPVQERTQKQRVGIEGGIFGQLLEKCEVSRNTGDGDHTPADIRPNRTAFQFTYQRLCSQRP